MSVCPFKPPRPPHRGPGVPAAPRAPGPVGAAGGGPPPAAAAGDEHPDQHGAAAEAGGAAAEGPPRRHHQHQLPAARLRYYITYLLPPSGHSLHSGHSARTFIQRDLPFNPTFTHRRRSQPRRATASSSGAVRGRCLPQGHLDTQIGGAGDRTSNRPVTSQTALPPELCWWSPSGQRSGHPAHLRPETLSSVRATVSRATVSRATVSRATVSSPADTPVCTSCSR